MNKLTSNVALAFAALSFLVFDAASANGQTRSNPNQPPPPTTRSDPRSPSFAEKGRQEVLMMRAAAAETERNRARLAAQLQEDFNRLQQINTEMIAPLLSAESLDYKVLTKTMSEISERATRIKYSVPLALRKKKAERLRQEPYLEKVESMLPELSRALSSFLGNPVFHISAPNDQQLRSQAGSDLEGIIKLSGTINKIAKRLSKPALASN